MWVADDGFGLSAILMEGDLYVGATTLLAMDVATGHVIWSTSPDDRAGFLVATDGAVLLLQSVDGPNEVEARSIGNGRLLWRDDLSRAVPALGAGVIGGLGTLPALRRLETMLQDQSVVVLG